VLPSVYTIGRYIVPPLRKIGIVTTVFAGRAGEMALNSAKIVRVGRKPVILVHTQSGQFRAFGATCTHLGCVIEYRSERGGYFHCNCHGGEYDLDGKNISGPPPRPLTPYSVSIRDENLIITGS
jgi:cytochrome b6-f complex iron-sulfur subunit